MERITIGQGLKHLVTIAVPGERIVATDAHPLYVRQAHDFVTAGNLKAGEQLELSSGAWVTIASVQRQDQVLRVYNLSVSSLHTFFAGSSSVLVHNCGQAAELGNKLDYFLGNATGSAHNIERSGSMASQLSRIGIGDTPTGRSILAEHLQGVYQDPSNIAEVAANGRTTRESLLAGPGGFLKMRSVWDDNKLITGELFGGG